MTPQLITPVFWFNSTAGEAVDFYLETFAVCTDTQMLHTQRYPAGGLPEHMEALGGDVATIDFRLGNMHLRALNSNQDVEKNPSISLTVLFDPDIEPDAHEKFTALWEALNASEHSMALMPDSDQYPFADRFGWVADAYGISWQLNLTAGVRAGKKHQPRIITSFMFGGPNINRAEEAAAGWVELFPGSEFSSKIRHDADQGPAVAGSLLYSEFQLAGDWFTAMDPGVDQDFSFVPSVSLAVACDDQTEIDQYWEALSANPNEGYAGWTTDQFGISWQVLPADLPELLANPGAFGRMMSMGKIDIARLAG